MKTRAQNQSTEDQINSNQLIASENMLCAKQGASLNSTLTSLKDKSSLEVQTSAYIGATAADDNSINPTAEVTSERQVMDVGLVISMFKNLSAEMKQMKSDIASLAATGQVSDESKGKFKDIEKAVESHEIEIGECSSAIKNQKTRDSILEGTVQRLAQQLKETQEESRKTGK